MLFPDLCEVIGLVKERISAHGAVLKENETRTRMALIDPLLQSLGWDTFDPALVCPEYDVTGRSKVDYALLSSGHPLILVEAKKLGEPLIAHRMLMQIFGYAGMLGIPYTILTDGNHWYMYNAFERLPPEDKLMVQVSITSDSVSRSALQLSTLQRDRLVPRQAMWEDHQPIAPQRILVEVAGHYGLELGDLETRNREHPVAIARQMSMYLLACDLNLPPTQIGRMLGGRHHSTVIHGVKNIKVKMGKDPALVQDAREILGRAGI